jgi:hypothetical protein
MPATGHSVTAIFERARSLRAAARRIAPVLACAILLAAARPGVASAPESVSDLFGSIAEELSSGNAPAFLGHFDSSMPGYERLRTDVHALADQGDLASSIDILKNEGDEQRRSVELDWELEITGKDDAGAARIRRQEIGCRLERRGKAWIIVSFEPLDFFAVSRPEPNK